MEVQNKRQKRFGVLPFAFGIGIIILLLAIWIGALGWKNQKDSQTEVKSDGYGETWVNQQADAQGQSHQESDAENQITTPEGFKIISYSEKWPKERLDEVYRELMSNVHGDEIEYLEYVVLYPQQETMQNEYEKLGSQSSLDKVYRIRLNLPFIVGNNFTYDIERKSSIINIYNMDAFSSIEDAAATISHEYGHHFTLYHFFKGEEPEASDYYRLRGLGQFEKAQEHTDYNEYIKNHMWSIYEIAAEDYVQILGSPNAHQIQEYEDVNDLMKSGDKEKAGEQPDVSRNYCNIYPQENIYLPLASENAQLMEYFYQFTNQPYQEKAQVSNTLELQFKSSTKNGKKFGKFTWNELEGQKNATYTLVCYSESGNLMRPVRTVVSGQKQEAYIGTVSYQDSDYIYFYNDHLMEDVKLFKLYVNLEDGRMLASPIKKIDFS